MARIVLVFAALLLAASAAAPPAQAGSPVGRGHGPPDTFPKAPVRCAIPPQNGGGVCTTGPFARVGESCFCEGPHGKQRGEVVWK